MINANSQSDKMDGMMHSANLGDSGYLVFRCTLEAESKADTKKSQDSDFIVHSNVRPVLKLIQNNSVIFLNMSFQETIHSKPLVKGLRPC
jgi:hypothetical protein